MAHARHRFWSDSLGYVDISWRGELGHRQVTAAYVAGWLVITVGAWSASILAWWRVTPMSRRG